MNNTIPCSIIMPVLNEAAILPQQLDCLQTLRQAGHELIIVDGGSSDDTPELARPYADHLLESPRGRGRQMNLGSQYAQHEWLIFLHADTQLSASAMACLQTALRQATTQWGRFDIQLSGRHALFRVIAWFMNKRSRLTGIATGDQAIFVNRAVFSRAGGFADMPLMEDIALSRILGKFSPPVCLRSTVTTSARRWQENGILKTILMMWLFRLRYFFGTSPEVLVERYYRVKK